MDRYYVWEIISYAWSEIGIEEDECAALVRKAKITPEHSRAYWMNFLNPLRLPGYPLTVLMALKYRSMLRRSVRANAAISTPE